MVPFAALAQAPADQPAGTTTAAATVPLDQQPTKEQLAKLFEAMQLRKQLDGVMKMLPAMIQQQIKSQMQGLTSKAAEGKQITPEQQAAIDKTMNKYLEKALSVYPVDAMLDDLTTIYQHHMSRTDVDAFIAFYNSTAGQHLLEQQPAIMREYMPMAMKRAQEGTKSLTNDLTRDLNGILESSPPAPPAAPNKPAL
jgi:hypothetical protein